KSDVPMCDDLRIGATPTEHAIAAGTAEAVRLLGAPAIVCITRTGGTARLVSSYRPPVPIVAVTDQERTWRQLALAWGVQPVHCTAGEISYESMLDAGREHLLRTRMAHPGQRVVVAAGLPCHVPGTTHMLRVEVLCGCASSGPAPRSVCLSSAARVPRARRMTRATNGRGTPRCSRATVAPSSSTRRPNCASSCCARASGT